MIAEDLTTYDDGKLNAVRNPDGIWINSAVFREEAKHFTEKGYYINAPWGSPDWHSYWSEQRRRCIEGYSVGGVKITGEHYKYLNFTPIKKTADSTKKKSRKIVSFPDFWDGDYNYFWVREIAKEGILRLTTSDEEQDKLLALPPLQLAKELEKILYSLRLEIKIDPYKVVKTADEEVIIQNLLGGFNIIVGKSRRKGYSFKSAATASCNYFTKPDSYTIFGAYEKRFLYPKGLFTMARNNITFINENTGWATPSDYVDRQDHIRASYKEYRNGIEIESGLMSEIQAITFKDNPDAARGKDAEDVFFEESGAFGTPGLLKAAYAATQDCVMDGAIKTGMITIFGTSGDMEGGTADYADMHSRPEAFGLMPFKNIWDKDCEHQTVGFFHPISWNMPGYYDEQGNSDFEGARKAEEAERALLIKNGATSDEIQKRQQEKPFGPNEAFSGVSPNNFPVEILKRQLEKVKANNWQETKGTPVRMYYEGNTVKAEPILDRSVVPITSYRTLPKILRGCPMIYEYPIVNPPKGLYKIGYDPVRQDQGSSLAAIIVYKGVHIGTAHHSIVVAEYIGRYDSPDDIDELADMFAEFYNAEIMHENEVTSVKNWFRRKKKLHRLAHQPDAVISKNIKKSKVARVYGCHMVDALKDAGERYVKDWLTEIIDYDENGDPVRVVDKIYSIRLLEELIHYYRKGNFDLISALFMCMFQVQEEVEGKKYGEEQKTDVYDELADVINTMYAA